MNATMGDAAPPAGAPVAAIGRWWTAGALVLGLLTVLVWLMGYGPGATACRSPSFALAEPVGAAPAPAAGATPAAAASTAPVTATSTAPIAAAPDGAPPAPSVAPASALPAPVAIHFAVGKAAASSDAAASLVEMVAFLQSNAGSRAVVSGFHDASGNIGSNSELAQARAQSVRDLLIAAGIPTERIELRKPVETTGSGSSDDARRVEVSVER